MKFFTIVLTLLCCILGLGLVVQAAETDALSTTEDTNILIFSESHTPESFTKAKQGVLKISVTAFGPIKSVLINSTDYPGSGDSRMELSHPFSLEEGANAFLVRVTTEQGSREKRFSITLGEKAKPKKSPLQLIAKLDLSSLDNVTSTADEDRAESDTKLTLVLVPIYDLAMGNDATLRFRGIVLRDKFSKSDFKANEISYTQIFAQWMQKKSPLGDYNVGVGYNDIRTNNDNPALGEDESTVETFVSAGLQNDIHKELSWTANAEVKLKDVKETAASANDEADARVISLDGGVDYKAGDITGGGELGYSINDAKGDYQDSSTTQYKLKAAYTIGEFIPKGVVSYAEKTRTNENASGLKQKDKTTTVTLKVDYKWKILDNSQWTLSWKSKNQTSNDAASEYGATTTTLGFTYVF